MHNESQEAIKELYRLLERRRFPTNKLVIIGSTVLDIQGLLDEDDKPSDVDVLTDSVKYFSDVIKIIKDEKIEGHFLTTHGYKNVLEFSYRDYKYNIHSGILLEFLLAGSRRDHHESENLKLNGRKIRLRPLNLIMRDLEKAADDGYKKYQTRLEYIRNKI
jgi:hypothetical protein